MVDLLVPHRQEVAELGLQPSSGFKLLPSPAVGSPNCWISLDSLPSARLLAFLASTVRLSFSSYVLASHFTIITFGKTILKNLTLTKILECRIQSTLFVFGPQNLRKLVTCDGKLAKRISKCFMFLDIL